MTVIAGTAPYSLDSEGVRAAVAAYEKHFPKGDARYRVMAG